MSTAPRRPAFATMPSSCGGPELTAELILPRPCDRHESLPPTAPQPRAAPVSALAAIYLRQRNSLAAFLRRRTRCEQAAEELLNDVWVRIARSPHGEAPANPEAFLQRVASNLAGDWLRRRKFRSEFIEPEADVTEVATGAPAIEEQLQHQQALEFLIQVIEELPPKRRQVFVLYRGEGLAVKDVARRLGISEKTVEHQVAKALIHCRSRLAAAGLWP